MCASGAAEEDYETELGECPWLLLSYNGMQY